MSLLPLAAMVSTAKVRVRIACAKTNAICDKADVILKMKTTIAAHPRKLKKLGHQKGKLQGCYTSRHSNEDPEGPARQQFSLEPTSTVVCLHRTI